MAELATKATMGHSLPVPGFTEAPPVGYVAVKEAVFPFAKFPGVDVVLGPEMKSTGEVMGLDADFRRAYSKAQLAAGSPLPTGGKVFLSVKDGDKRRVAALAQRRAELGFSLVATAGTAKGRELHGLEAEALNRVGEGYRPN